MTTKQLLNCGAATVIIFWLSTIIGGFIHGNYSHLTDTISEVGALGTKSRTFMAYALWLGTATGLLFAVGAYRACREMGLNIVPILPIITIPFSFAWVALFPSGTNLHPYGGDGMLLLYITIPLSIILWRRPNLLGMRLWSLVSAVLLYMLFLRLVPPFRGQFEGLTQRFAHLGWSVWFVAINIRFVQLLNNKYAKKVTT
jgi:hypothetical membrane protein